MSMEGSSSAAGPEIGARAAFEELKPVVHNLIKMVATCPISDVEKNGLALLVATSFVGAALAQAKLDPTPENAEAIGKMIADSMRAKMN